MFQIVNEPEKQTLFDAEPKQQETIQPNQIEADVEDEEEDEMDIQSLSNVENLID